MPRKQAAPADKSDMPVEGNESYLDNFLASARSECRVQHCSFSHVGHFSATFPTLLDLQVP